MTMETRDGLSDGEPKTLDEAIEDGTLPEEAALAVGPLAAGIGGSVEVVENPVHPDASVQIIIGGSSD